MENQEPVIVEGVTPSQYALMRGITLSAVTKAIRGKREMPGVLKVQKFSRFYLLTINAMLV